MLSTPSTRDCEHGRLARSCEVCELEAEVARLREALDEIQSTCIAGANALAPRNVVGRVVAIALRALGAER